MGETTELYTFRPYTPDDVSFIHSSWLKSYYEHNDGHKQLTLPEFDGYHRPIRNQILSQDNVAGIVCVSAEMKDHILGWILVEKPETLPYLICHYMYVKSTLTGEGIGSRLVKMALPVRPVLYTHTTTKAWRVIKANWKSGRDDFSRWFFTPHLLRNAT